MNIIQVNIKMFRLKQAEFRLLAEYSSSKSMETFEIALHKIEITHLLYVLCDIVNIGNEHQKI